jgi:tetratricopeptide (TPR) repeat protein
MPRVARLPEWDRVRSDEAGPRATKVHRLKYYAFLSYSHSDEATADWLHGALERFRTPGALAGRLTDNGVIPRRLTPIFRDRHELPASQDLAAGIREALDSSQFLIVLCSPAAAASRWVNAEIDMFKRHRPDGCVLAAIVSGEPFASDMPGREAEECLPPALRLKYDRRGRPTTRPAEPLAADLRDHRDGKRLGLLKLIAGMFGVGLDELVQREAHRRQRRLGIVAAASLAGMAVTSTLAIVALDSRDEARDQRREAEGLVGFMLGDLRSKLEPLGRLDALDAVGARALKYFESQDKSELSDAALAQRSGALTLMGEIANARGDLKGAERRYREALAGTGEALRRAPDDPQRIFDHAQNVFWVGSLAWQRGQPDAALRAFSEYKQLSGRMIAAEPDQPKWRLESIYADTNLGRLILDQRNYEQAAAVFKRSLGEIETLASSNPRNRDYQIQLLETLAYLSQAQENSGAIESAVTQRERQIDLLQRLIAADPADADFQRKSMTAHRALARLLGWRGETRIALEHSRTAVEIGDRLIALEPGNSKWREFISAARLERGQILLRAGQVDEAASATRAGCYLSDQLVARDATVVQWRDLKLTCLRRRAQLAKAEGAPREALAIARQALVAAQSLHSGNAIEDKFNVAGALALIGDIRDAMGEHEAAQTAWQQALAEWPQGVGERPDQIERRANLLKRLGKAPEAKALNDRLDAMGFRRTI